MIRILLNECLPVKLKFRFEDFNAEFKVSTVTSQNWTGIKNGKLLNLAQQHFDVFVTSDRHIRFQQMISKYSIIVVVLKTKSNRYNDVLNYIDRAGEIIKSARPGKYYEISVPTVRS